MATGLPVTDNVLRAQKLVVLANLGRFEEVAHGAQELSQSGSLSASSVLHLVRAFGIGAEVASHDQSLSEARRKETVDAGIANAIAFARKLQATKYQTQLLQLQHDPQLTVLLSDSDFTSIVAAARHPN